MNLASLSDYFVNGAAVVMALAFLAHAAEWAFTRERATRVPRVKEAARVGAVAAGSEAEAVEAGQEIPNVADGTDTGDVAEERRERFGRIGVGLTILATVLLAVGVVARGFAAERVPWSNLYEFATTGTLIVALAYLVASKRYSLGWLGMPVTGFLLIVLGIATTVLYVPVGDLIPALQSYWLVIHVSAAVTATGVFTVGAMASALQLVRARAEKRAIANETPVLGRIGRLPTAEAIDRVAYRLHAFAFPIWMFALIAGAIWAAEAWGRYWGWDPKETWMFITWVCYAAYLHARSTAGWRSRASWIALASYGALLFNLIGVNFVISGLHSYAGI